MNHINSAISVLPDLQHQLTSTLSVPFRNSSVFARKILVSAPEQPVELPAIIEFDPIRVNLGSPESENDQLISDIESRIQSIYTRLRYLNADVRFHMIDWFVMSEAVVRELYWTNQDLITDLVKLLVDLEYEMRIREVLAISEKEKARIQEECQNTVLDRHHAELKAMLERLDQVKVSEALSIQ